MSVSSDIFRENSCDLFQDEEPCDDEIKSAIDGEDKEFPMTSIIRVLLVDSNPESLRHMKNLMTQFSYQVTNYINGDEAIAFLMKSKHEIDLVIWDFHVPEINGIEALKTISKEMDLPVVIMSRDHKKETVMKSTKYGACDFLVKPVSKEVMAVLWRHVYHKRMSKSGLDKPNESDSVESVPVKDEGLGHNNDLYQSNEEGSKNVEDSGEQNTSDQKGVKYSSKKQRMTWTPKLHQMFERAVEKIGSVEEAVPKQILKLMQEEMNVEGLTRNNVASHLQRLRWQKYRQNVEKKPCVPLESSGQDSGWHNAAPNTCFTASKPLLNSSINLQNRVACFMNSQAASNAPLQHPSTSYLTTNNSSFMMTNPLANLPYIDSFHQPQVQHYHSSLQLPASVITKQEPGHVPSSMDISGLIYSPNLPIDFDEYFPPEFNNFNQINR